MIYYASLGLEDARALTQGFEKKYPFIKTDVFRSGHEKILSRPELAENLEENNRLYEEIFVR